MTETFKSVWDALETDPAERESMKIKSRLMMDIESCMKKQGLTQKQAAKKWALPSPGSAIWCVEKLTASPSTCR